MRHLIISTLLFLTFFNCGLVEGQPDGDIVNKETFTNKELLEQFSEIEGSERFVVQNSSGAQWKEEYRYIEDLTLASITYLSDGLKVKGFLLQPKREGHFPSIIYNRGGNRDFGALNPIRAIFLGGHLAKNGYVVIFSNYRGVDGGDGMEEFGGRDVNDVLNLIPALTQVPKADTSQIGMYGWSRGGMMTYLALRNNIKIQAAVVGGAVSDNFETISDRPDMETHVLSELIPNYENNKEKELVKRSAIRWVDKFPKDIPLLIMHGNSDWRVKPEQSLNLALELEKNRVPYRLIIFEGGDHGISEHRDEVNTQVLSWFNRFLKNKESLPNMQYHGR